MFSEKISGSADLLDEILDDEFSNIKFTSNYHAEMFDRSLECYLRIIYGDRLGEEQIIVETSPVTSDALENIEGVFKKEPDGTTHLLFAHSQCEERDSIFSELREELGKMPDVKRLSAIEDYYSKNFKAEVYQSEEKKVVAIISDNITIQNWHFLQSVLCKTTPWFFKDKPLTQDEIDFCQSLCLSTAGKYSTMLSKIGEFKYKVQSKKAQKQIIEFEDLFNNRRSSYLEREMADVDYKIDTTLKTLHALYAKRNDLVDSYKGLMLRDKTIELASILNSENIEISTMCISDGYLNYVVKGYVRFFDVEELMIALKNKGTWVYARDGMYIPLLKALFVDETMKLRICAAYRLHLDSELRALEHFAFSCDYDTYLPNPHVNNHACLGEHAIHIENNMSSGNVDLAITQTLSSAYNLNFVDYHVMSGFIRDLGDTPRKCIELSDGTCVTPNEALRILEVEKEEE